MADELKHLLESALPPVDPPVGLESRLESALQGLADAVSEELSDWELAAMRDPRNWVRPVVAVSAGTMAGAALYLLRQQQRQRQPHTATDHAKSAVRRVAELAARARLHR